MSVTENQVKDAIRLLQQLAAPCVGTSDHAWRKCKRCQAMHGLEMRFDLSMRLLNVAIESLVAKAEGR